MRTLIRPGAFQVSAGVPVAVAPSSVNGPVSQAGRSPEPATLAGSLRTICSWCETLMVDGPPAPVSHGICGSCFDTVIGDAA